jgi:signal transduction histidine kinase
MTLTEEWQERVPQIVMTIHDRGTRSFECDRVRRDGSTFPTTTEVVAARCPAGELLYRLVFVTDRTELRAREAAERGAVERFEGVFESAPVGLVLIRAGVIERINAAASTIMGGCAEDFVGVDQRMVFHLAEAPMLGSADAAFRDAIALPPQERQISRPDGAVTHIRYTYAILPDSTASLVLVLIEDRTAEVEARAREEQLRVFEDRDRIAHDLHDNAIQHLFAIGMTVQSIAAALPDSEHARRLERTLSDIDHTIRGIRSVIQVLHPSVFIL